MNEHDLEPEPEHEEDEPLRYFVPGELIVEVKYTEKFSLDKFVGNPVFEPGAFNLLYERLRDFANDDLPILEAAQAGAVAISVSDEWVTTLENPKPFVEIKGEPPYVHSYVRLKFESLARDGTVNKVNTNETLIYLAGELELRAKDPKLQQGETQTISGVCLNWLWGSAPDNQTSGGPGSLPVKPDLFPPDKEDEDQFYVWADSFRPPALKRNSGAQEGKPDRKALKERLALDREDCCPSEVIILDTIPPRETLRTWTTLSNERLKELLQHLHFDVESEETLEYYEQKAEDDAFNFDSEHPYAIKDHHYDMSDHGLFIAGIIHRIAPKAKIRMIEVLNQYGVGSSRALIWGLQKILDCCNRSTWLIVNSSLTIGFSYEVAKAIAEQKKGNPNPSDVEKFIHLLERLREREPFCISSPIEQAYREVITSFNNAISVAAAGNDNPADKDGQPGPSSRTRARFPAAYESVIGVGALTRKAEPARYSNKPDDPESDGFYVFGGDVDKRKDNKKDGKWIAKNADGILGLYTYDTYPDGTDNTSGWARWAGTSFASAVATGILAQICVQDGTQLKDREAIKQLLRDVAEEVEIGGHVIPVGQGGRGLDPDKAQ